MNGQIPPGGRVDDFDDDVSDPRADALAAMLSKAAVWATPPPIEAAVVAAIATEVQVRPVDRGPVSDDPRFRHRLLLRVAAAVVVLAAAAGAVVTIGDDARDDGSIEVALEGTDAAASASATAQIEERPGGLFIRLEVEGLAPAPIGQYYQAWVRAPDGEPAEAVSAGTFHLRGGDDSIGLWSGLSWSDTGMLTVTIEDVGGGPASSGRVVLRSG